jgi:hypothetical protein
VVVSQVPVWPPAFVGQSAFTQQPVEAMQILAAWHFFGVAPPQVKSHVAAVQVGVPPGGAVQGSHRVPHV